MTTSLNRRQMLSFAATLLLGGAFARDTLSARRDNLVANFKDFSAQEHFDVIRLFGQKIVGLMPLDQQQLLDAAGIGAAIDAQAQFAGYVHKRQQDFLLGRTRIVSGWVLAEAECALCILCSQA